MGVAVDQRLDMLRTALRRSGGPPDSGRSVIMAARIAPAGGVGTREFAALDPGARVPGGRVLPLWIDDTEHLEIVAWNTGESSDLKRYGNFTHAERQFRSFVGDRSVSRIEIELTHSPCTACATMLAGWLRDLRAQGTTFARRQVGERRFVMQPAVPDIPAVLRWARLYETQPQATTWPYLDELHDAGWHLAAPGTGLPQGIGRAPVVLL